MTRSARASSQPTPQSTTPGTSPPSRIGLGAYFGTFASSLFIQGCTLLQGVIVARLLGPAARGELAAAILWPTWFATVGLLGIDVAIARSAGRRVDLQALSRTAVLLSLSASAVAVVAAWLLIPSLVPEHQRALVPLARVALGLIPLSHLSLTLQAVEQGAGRFGLLNLSRATLYPVNLGVLVLMWLLGASSVRWVISALLIANASVVGLLLFAKGRDLFTGRKVMPPMQIAREGLRYGLVTIGNLIHQRVDQILLVWLLPTEELGFYVVALSAASVVSSAASSISMVCFTHAAQAPAGQGFAQVARDFRRAAVLCMAGGLAIAPSLPLLLPLVYGAAFSRSTPVAMSLVLGSVLAGLGQILDQALRGQGRPYSGLLGRVLAIGVAAVAGCILTPILGLVGMATAYCASQLTYLVVLASSCVRHYENGTPSLLCPRPGDARSVATTLWNLAHRLLRPGLRT